MDSRVLYRHSVMGPTESHCRICPFGLPIILTRAHTSQDCYSALVCVSMSTWCIYGGYQEYTPLLYPFLGYPLAPSNYPGLDSKYHQKRTVRFQLSVDGGSRLFWDQESVTTKLSTFRIKQE